MAHIFALSDIHGDADLLKARLVQLDELYHIFSPSCKGTLVVCGDLIDGERKSAEVIEYLCTLQNADGLKVVVLKGNHEASFLDFVVGQNEAWITDPFARQTFYSFFSDTNQREFERMPEKAQGELVQAKFLLEKKEIVDWLKQLPLYYETQKQIFVHAGVDEAAQDLWKVGTGEDTFLFKSFIHTGPFLKDVVAGHMNVRFVSGDPNFEGVFWDGASHFYIDGSGARKLRLPVLIYDEEMDAYSQLLADGSPQLVKKAAE